MRFPVNMHPATWQVMTPVIVFLPLCVTHILGFQHLLQPGPTLACIHFLLLSPSLSNKMDIFFKSDVKCFNKEKLNDTEEHTSTKRACETVPNECFVFVCVCVCFVD